MRSDAPAQPAALPLALAAETIAGLVLGAVFAPLFGLGSGLLLPALGIGKDLGMGMLVVMVYTGLLGFALGASAGIALVGSWLRQGGSMWLALLGGVIGGVLATILARVGAFGSGDRFQIVLVVLIGLALALLGYNLRRRAVPTPR
ncbi:MAG TPA: hypothetical protein VF897_04680 [Roseiflexaceae bacterium]